MFNGASYNQEEKLLCITFPNGGVYKYYDVPQDIADGLADAEKQSKYFVDNIRNKFKYEKE